MNMIRLALLLLILAPRLIFAVTQPQPLNQLFENLKQDPQALRIFLAQMPKGGELHYHWDGSTYPENLAYIIRDSNFCYNPANFGVDPTNVLCRDEVRLNNFATKPTLYQELINNWSLTADYENRVVTNQHFFQFFLGTEPIVAQHSDAMLVDEMQRAASQHEDYMELTYILDLPQMISLGSQIKFNPDFNVMKQAVDKTNVTSIVNDISSATTKYYQQAQQIMHCGTSNADPACRIKVGFIFSAMRNMSPATVFTQLAIAFKAASINPLIIAVDLVGPENDYNASRDYALQMQMVRFFHQLYPQVHIRLHAGELSLEEAPPNFMQDHVAQAINVAEAERIGHGVDIAHETNSLATLNEMAQRHICMEQLLTSNEKMLNIKGADHPLPLYLRYRIPVVLSTDDEGILRTTLTTEFYKAVTRYNLSYDQTKTMVRNVLSCSFLPGKNLWQDWNYSTPIVACEHDKLGTQNPSAMCAAFLQQNEKAQMQWRLEGELNNFENTIVQQM